MRALSWRMATSLSGEPATAMKSAARPGSSTPNEPPLAMKPAVTAVAARSAAAGVKPRSFTKISISRACHSP